MLGYRVPWNMDDDYGMFQNRSGSDFMVLLLRTRPTTAPLHRAVALFRDQYGDDCDRHIYSAPPVLRHPGLCLLDSVRFPVTDLPLHPFQIPP